MPGWLMCSWFQSRRITNIPFYLERDFINASRPEALQYMGQASNAMENDFDLENSLGIRQVVPIEDALRHQASRLLRRELLRQNLQLLAVVLREFQGGRSGPVEVDPAEIVSDADSVLVGVLTCRFGEDMADEFAHAADTRAADQPKGVSFGKPTNVQTVRIIARIDDQSSASSERS